MKTGLFNPFKFIAGYKALLLGIATMLITAIVCFLEKTHLDGVIDMHEGKITPSYCYFIEPLIDWLCLIIPLYISGRIFSASAIRFIDVAGTSALARYPIFFVVIIGLLVPDLPKDRIKLIDTIQSNPHLLLQLIVVAILIIPMVVWMVTLMYNAYTISVNLKGPKAAWSFVASILIAEIVSKIIIKCMI